MSPRFDYLSLWQSLKKKKKKLKWSARHCVDLNGKCGQGKKNTRDKPLHPPTPPSSTTPPLPTSHSGFYHISENNASLCGFSFLWVAAFDFFFHGLHWQKQKKKKLHKIAPIQCVNFFSAWHFEHTLPRLSRMRMSSVCRWRTRVHNPFFFFFSSPLPFFPLCLARSLGSLPSPTALTHAANVR